MNSTGTQPAISDEFLRFAQEAVQNQQSGEGRLRSAISRAYYAVYLRGMISHRMLSQHIKGYQRLTAIRLLIPTGVLVNGMQITFCIMIRPTAEVKS